MTTFSKLQWQKELRGHALSATEYLVLSTIATYTDATGTGAHPGWSRLAADTSLDARTIKRAVKVLLAGRYLEQTAEGGNQYSKGRANEYALLPASLAFGAPAPEGGHPVSPFDDEPDGPARGALGAARGTSGAVEGVQPVSPHQITTSGPSIIPPPSETGASPDALRIPTSSGPSRPDWSLMSEDFESLSEWLDAELGDGNWDNSTAEGMWLGESHPKAIRNKLRKDAS